VTTRCSTRAGNGGSPHGSVRGRRTSHDADVVLVFALAWLVSALHVAGTLLAGRPFGVEATLASFALFAIPVATWPGRVLARHPHPEDGDVSG
jgi:hypothetical protein